MAKIPDCDYCLFYTRSDYLICPVHPYGVHGDFCLDFRLNPDIELEFEEEQWSPEGYSYYDGELVPNRPSRYTSEEQLEILDTHPFFTGVCPKCGHRFDKSNPPKVHWDCPNPDCGWVDDSVH